MIRENQKYLNRILGLFDALCIFFAFILSYQIRFGLFKVEGSHLPFEEYIKPVVFVIPIYIFLYRFFELYKPYRIKSFYREFFNILKANITGVLLFIFILFTLKNIDYSRYFIMIFFIISVVLVSLERFVLRLILRNLRKRGYNKKYILIVGVNSLTKRFLETIERNGKWGYEIFGIVDNNKAKGSKINGKSIIGNINDLKGILSNHGIDEVFVTLDVAEYDNLKYIINSCEKTGVRMEIIPNYVEYFPGKPYLDDIDGIPVLNTRYIPLDDVFNRTFKRIFDVIISSIAIIIFSPIMILTTVIIKITSPGPVIFKQERVGYNKKLFMMYKFRSMKVQKVSDEEKEWTTKDDPRKTKFGTFIRKTSIDELPQLFNVFKGDMSLVGPRPERPHFVEIFKETIPKYMVKHQVAPGITGWAQVNGLRGDTSIRKRVEYDIFYIENWTIALDIKIIWYTVFKGFINKNAY